LPFFPLICFLIAPEYFGKIALWVLAVLVFSSIDNTALTAKYLSPKKFIEDSINDKAISQYLALLTKELKKEIEEHKCYLDNIAEYQMPIHAYHFEPDILGLEPTDIWDSITVTTNLAIENNDYPVFRQSLSAIFKLIVKF